MINGSIRQESTLVLWRTLDSSRDLLGPVLHFFQSMATLRVTEAEYTLLAATVLLCSGGAASRRVQMVTTRPLVLGGLAR